MDGPADDATVVVPRDAATVILLRDVREGVEVFMVRRHRAVAFMGGAHVFPGGKLEASDLEPSALARTRGRTAARAAELLGAVDPPETALGLHVAAVRETFEESGVLLGELARPERIPEARRALAAGTSFSEVLDDLGATLRLDWLVPYSRWITPRLEPRRFDARFFLARVPPGQTPEHDAAETTEALWLSPRSALARHEEGSIVLPPPTLRTLELLSAASSADELLELGRHQPIPVIEPMMLEEGGRLVLVLPGDPAHPSPRRALTGPLRYELRDGRFVALGASARRA